MPSIIPDCDHVLRHVPGSKIQQNKVDGSAFVLIPGHAGLSVDWREAAGYEPADQLPAVRQALRRLRAPSHRLVELNVGTTREFVACEAATIRNMVVALRFEHDPLPATPTHPEEPYHGQIYGTPLDDLEAKAIGDLIAQCVIALYEAK